ncbi:MAG: class I SAM-dependent methyltransferase [Thaumarchaeota archaeon]|nr:class I SAM-dependent methyltransferase [Nitrososphaerota archaeon]
MPARASYYESNWLSTRWRRSLAKMIREMLPPEWEGSELLDVGVGDGYTARLVKPRGKVTGIDFDEESVGDAKERGIDAQFGSVYELPLPDNAFDVIMCVEVLEHLEKPIEALKEISRVLRVGGHLVITTPVPNLPWRLIWWVWTKFGPGKKWESIPHISELRIGDRSSADGGVEAMLTDLSFEVLKTSKCNYGMVAGLLARKRS